MIRLPLTLTHLPFIELLRDIQLILDHDRQELQRQTAYFRQLEKEGSKSPTHLEKFEGRLHHAQNRQEFLTALVSRLQTRDFIHMLKAIEMAKAAAIKNGNPDLYGFALIFHLGKDPEIILY